MVCLCTSCLSSVTSQLLWQGAYDKLSQPCPLSLLALNLAIAGRGLVSLCISRVKCKLATLFCWLPYLRQAYDLNTYHCSLLHGLVLMQLWERFRPGQTPPQQLGASRDYNIDLVPKFIMAHGNLVRPPTQIM